MNDLPTPDLFYVSCAYWNIYVKDCYRVDNLNRTVNLVDVNLSLIDDLLSECLSREDLTKEEALACCWMANVLTGSKEWREKWIAKIL